METFADYLFFNGTVITVNQDDEIVDGVAVKGNKIMAVGSEAEVRNFLGPETKEIDLNGRCLMPGFIDSHIHFGIYGMKQGPVIDVEYSKANSIKVIQEKIKEATAKKQPGEWICLSGYDQNKLEEGRHPTKEDFDLVAPNNPVRCTRACAHMGVYNTLALEMCNIKPEDYAPGEVVVEDGQLTGLLKENAHMEMALRVSFTEEEVREGLMASDKIMHQYGITTVHDAGLDGAGPIRYMERCSRNGDIKTRIRMMIFDLAGKEPGKDLIDKYIGTGLTTGFGNDRFAIGPIKLMLDGSSSGPSCATKAPYNHDPDLKGILVWNQEETTEWIIKSHNAGFQVTAHAVGDMAVEIMVNAIEAALNQNPRTDHRHRIEHCGITSPELIDRIRDLGIVPVSNPGFVDLNGKDYNRYYEDRVNYMFACRTYIDKGIISSIGSDGPIITPNPMNSLYGAVARADKKTGELVGEMQRITMMEAIRMFTYNGAYCAFDEDKLGSIEPDKLADMIILSEDILKTPVDRIKQVTVDFTMIDGQVVYEV